MTAISWEFYNGLLEGDSGGVVNYLFIIYLIVTMRVEGFKPWTSLLETLGGTN